MTPDSPSYTAIPLAEEPLTHLPLKVDPCDAHEQDERVHRWFVEHISYSRSLDIVKHRQSLRIVQIPQNDTLTSY